MMLDDLDPPGNPVELLNDVAAFVRRYVWFPSEHYAFTVALWCAHAHLLRLFDSTPRLAILAPEKQSGKTRLLEVIESLVPNPMRSANTSSSALFRLISSEEPPTVLLDEADTIWSFKGSNEDLRALINAGHRRGSNVHRVMGEGRKMKAQEFASFAACALAGIGELPDTVMDRSIVLNMKRRAPNEPIERWHFSSHVPQGHALRDRLAAWAATIESLEAPPDEFGISDRAFDVWEPLLAIGQRVGGTCMVKARAACTAIAGDTPATISRGQQLLSDLRDVWPESEDFVPTSTVIELLHGIEEGPWGPGGFLDKGGRGITAHGLARILRDYQIRSTQRTTQDRIHGYFRHDFADAWNRYLAPSHPAAIVRTVPSVPTIRRADTQSVIDPDGDSSADGGNQDVDQIPLHACGGVHCQVCGGRYKARESALKGDGSDA